jgi:hypothetical protein
MSFSTIGAQEKASWTGRDLWLWSTTCGRRHTWHASRTVGNGSAASRSVDHHVRVPGDADREGLVRERGARGPGGEVSGWTSSVSAPGGDLNVVCITICILILF